MAKFKPVRGKAKKGAGAGAPGGVPCVILVIAGMALVMVFLYFVMKSNAI